MKKDKGTTDSWYIADKTVGQEGSANYMQVLPNNPIAQSTGRFTVAVAGDPDRISEFLKELNNRLDVMLNAEYIDLRLTQLSSNLFSDTQRFSLPYNR